MACSFGFQCAHLCIYSWVCIVLLFLHGNATSLGFAKVFPNKRKGSLILFSHVGQFCFLTDKRVDGRSGFSWPFLTKILEGFHRKKLFLASIWNMALGNATRDYLCENASKFNTMGMPFQRGDDISRSLLTMTGSLWLGLEIIFFKHLASNLVMLPQIWIR